MSNEVLTTELSTVEKTLAKQAPLLNAKLVHGKLVLNAPGGEAYWGVRLPHVGELLSPEAAIARARAINLVYGAARGHTFPWTNESLDDWLQVGGAGNHDDTIELVYIQEAVAAWLGYKTRFEYAEACEQAPDLVAQRLKEAN